VELRGCSVKRLRLFRTDRVDDCKHSTDRCLKEQPAQKAKLRPIAPQGLPQ